MSRRLSVCLLTRNEGPNIERAIRSVGGVADEVVVADTGSTDGTRETARGLGAEVFSIGWDDDFSAGRNFALGRATGDWVLWLNPDEELLPSSHSLVRNLIGSEDDAFGYLVRVQSIPRAERPDQMSETLDLRLYRRRPDLCYVGRLHPGFAPELARAVAGEGRQVRASGLVIRHHASTSVVNESKLRWAAELLERELRDRPGRLPYLIEYGRNLLSLHDPRGHAVMAEAAEQVAAVIRAPAPPCPEVQILLEYALKTPTGPDRSQLLTDQAVALARRWFPNSPPLLWAIAESSFRARNFLESTALLERLVELGLRNSYDHAYPFDPRIVGSWALLNLGQCYRAQGRMDAARRCFGRLLGDPDFEKQAAKFLGELQGTAQGNG